VVESVGQASPHQAAIDYVYLFVLERARQAPILATIYAISYLQKVLNLKLAQYSTKCETTNKTEERMQTAE